MKTSAAALICILLAASMAYAQTEKGFHWADHGDGNSSVALPLVMSAAKNTTYEVWARPDAGNTTNGAYLQFAGTGGLMSGQGSAASVPGTAGTVFLLLENGVAWITTGATVTNDTWTLWDYTVSNDTPPKITIYQNGTVVYGPTDNSPGAPNGTGLLGYSDQAADRGLHNACIAKVAIYGTALSGTRITAHASATNWSDYNTAVLADSPLGYWKLADSPITTAVDSSGNGNNGTVTNTGGKLSQCSTGPLADPPTATPTPAATATQTPVPTATATPEPTATATPNPTPVPATEHCENSNAPLKKGYIGCSP